LSVPMLPGRRAEGARRTPGPVRYPARSRQDPCSPGAGPKTGVGAGPVTLFEARCWLAHGSSRSETDLRKIRNVTAAWVVDFDFPTLGWGRAPEGAGGRASHARAAMIVPAVPLFAAGLRRGGQKPGGRWLGRQ